MMELADIETEIEDELEDEYERDEDEFETDTEYQAYKIVKNNILMKAGFGSNINDDKSGFALPAYRPKKVIIGENGLEYTIKGIKVERFKDGPDKEPTILKAKAIQS